MTIESDSSNLPTPEPVPENDLQPDDFDGSASEKNLSSEALATQQALAAIASLKSPQYTTAIQQARSDSQQPTTKQFVVKPRALLITLIAIAITFIGVILNNWIVGIIGTLITLFLSLAILLPWLQKALYEWFSPQERTLFVAILGLIVAIIGLIKFTGVGDRLLVWGRQINWDIAGTLADWFGALGQILIAVIAVYVAWRQYVISKDLTRCV